MNSNKTILLVILLLGAVSGAGILYITTISENTKPPEQPKTSKTEEEKSKPEEPEPTGRKLSEEPEIGTDHNQPKTKPEKVETGKKQFPRLDEVIKNARTWKPVFREWENQPAPDFTITDINGENHSLSEYRGKNVIVVFWASWCTPCLREIPNLIALQNVLGKDELMILGISYTSANNSEKQMKEFVKSNDRLNYPVFAVERSAMPAPYNKVTSIPCSFFIDKKGKIKLSVLGQLHYTDLKNIVKAK